MPKAKAKTNWKQIHKIKVHENRWLAWTIAIAVFACAALIGRIQLDEIYFQNDMTYDPQMLSTWASYSNKNFGYTVKYPKNWDLELNGSSMLFENLKDPNEYFSVTVYSSDEEEEVRAALFTTKEEMVRIGGHSATRISQSKQEPEGVILFHDNDQLFVLKGKGSNFERIAGSFKLSEKLERI